MILLHTPSKPLKATCVGLRLRAAGQLTQFKRPDLGRHSRGALLGLTLTSHTKSLNQLKGACCSLTTPHSGYHFDGRLSRFFEGWYFRVRWRCEFL
jgi:hypothetical protein